MLVVEFDWLVASFVMWMVALLSCASSFDCLLVVLRCTCGLGFTFVGICYCYLLFVL